MSKTKSQYYDFALGVTRQYASDLRDANARATKPSLCESRATSRSVTENYRLAATSMNDILNAAQADGLLADPLMKARLLNMSSVLNSDVDAY